jgi:hypothetical protein
MAAELKKLTNHHSGVAKLENYRTFASLKAGMA